MDLDLDVVIGSPNYAVEMKSGLKTMQGASDTMKTIAEGVLGGEVTQRKTYKGGVRTDLKASFEGSFGQNFSIRITDTLLEQRLKEIGWENFCELASYFMNDSVYKESERLSEGAQEILDGLGSLADELSKQLRKSAMRNLHDTSFKFDYEVKIRFSKNRDDKIVLAKFNRDTGRTLLAKLSRVEITIKAAVTRFNIHTGNGRLQIRGENQTTAFGFGVEYKIINMVAKKELSDNLTKNNGIDPEHFIYLTLRAKTLKLGDGAVVKYIVSDINDA